MDAKIFNIQKFSLHDGPGIRTSIFFSGCSLRCKWCANPECNVSGKATSYSPEELLAEVLKDKAFFDKSGGGVTLTGGEIFLQQDFIHGFCALLKANGIHIALETAGATDTDSFASMIALADFVYMDCKHYDDAKHLQGTGCSNRNILANMQLLAACGKPYCVRIPVIPGYNDSIGDARNFARLFQSLGVQDVELLPFHQFGEDKYETLGLPYDYRGVPQLHKEELQSYAAVLKAAGFAVIMH